MHHLHVIGCRSRCIQGFHAVRSTVLGLKMQIGWCVCNAQGQRKSTWVRASFCSCRLQAVAAEVLYQMLLALTKPLKL